MQQTLFEDTKPILLKEIVIDSASKHTSCNWQLSKEEIWLGNSTRGIPEDCNHLKTIRLGVQAYCIKGTKLHPNFILPLIIHKSEEMAYDRVMMKRMENIRR